MDDRDLEDILRRYRPVAPPLDLRARVIDAAASSGDALVGSHGRTWPWMVAAAALLVVAAGLQIGAGRSYARAGELMPQASVVTSAEAEALRESGVSDTWLTQIARQRELQMSEEARAFPRE